MRSLDLNHWLSYWNLHMYICVKITLSNIEAVDKWGTTGNNKVVQGVNERIFDNVENIGIRISPYSVKERTRHQPASCLSNVRSSVPKRMTRVISLK